MIKIVVFDFDGTLVQSNEIKRNVFDEVVEKAGGTKSLVAEIFVKYPKADRIGILNEIAKRLIETNQTSDNVGLLELADRLIEDYTNVCEDRIAACPETEGASETLEILKDWKLRLFLNSATPVETLNKIIHRRDLMHYFDSTFGRPDLKEENLRSILRQTGCALEELMVVGDGEDDRASAAALNCQFAALDIGSPPLHNRFKELPELVLKSLKELPAYLTKMK